ncbi:sugar kinase [Marinomonas mediterranea]|jgi:2-keto-3-deoxygluconate kinase (EC 2.7.1.45)|uniref:2-dehydro-3-deoxygluconokinase n=1 Tax=Marinomonas mediterranea (strain ATCC 700492 / JCM 21426 / NBRC 103028 / MMB-1) TaxID=717774 RepID=F2K0B0_MARM1|nr:sugar kinase [Marinomonas mediterranea]ADZ89825.1 2-dehydro-3-deoxygluconokinase [Marinomonas mediterranea MMB-1]WCN16046.1 sugar kinase [Marinomonas mediterranea MMB-1]
MQIQNKDRRVGVIGECMVELQGTMFSTLKQSFGGDTFNTAVYLKRLLGSSYQISYLTGLGLDPLSEYMLEQWREECIDTRYVARIDDKLPGLYQISVAENGERTFQYWRNDAAAKYIFDEESVDSLEEILSQFGWLYLSGISLAILTEKGRETLLSALEIYTTKGGKLFFDNNYRPILWPDKEVCQSVYMRVLALSHIALLTEEDEHLLWGESSIDHIFDSTPTNEIAIKRGSKPCLINEKGMRVAVPAQPVSNIVDTTAAGDSFAAGYCCGRIIGLSPEESAEKGHVVAARVIQFPGAIIAKESWEKLVSQ